MLKQDILRTYHRAKGGRFRRILHCVRSPGVHAVVDLRFAQWLRRRPLVVRLILKPWRWLLHHWVLTRWGICIAPDAEIGEGCYIGHFGGIVVGGNVRIGRNVNLSQGVTIGVAGQGDRRGSPSIGDNVYIAPGAKIFGRIRVGSNVKIGANAVIHKDVPDNAVAVLSPGFTLLDRDPRDPVCQKEP
ncbi:MAG: serine acetyltransferase [Planctomycetes bacterium]|nr:serine acetyltransferase [Planctomycetota bacterium]